MGMLDGGFEFWNAVLVTIGATNPVDVAGAFGADEGGVHRFDIETAVGHLGMAGLAGGCRALVVAGMAGEAADAFVDAHGRAVVARADLRTPVIRITTKARC